MATFLEICRDALEQSGTGDSAEITNVATADGIQGTIVGHVQTAWERLQLDREDWFWMQKEATFRTVADKASYTPEEMLVVAAGARAVPTWRSWRTDRPWYVGTDAQMLRKIEYEVWRRWSKVETADGQPQVYAVGYGNEINLRPVPDAIYPIEVAYQTGLQRLTANDDVPLMPPQHHSILKWHAVMLTHGYDTDSESYQFAAMQYAEFWTNLLRDQSPGWKTGGTLA